MRARKGWLVVGLVALLAIVATRVDLGARQLLVTVGDAVELAADGVVRAVGGLFGREAPTRVATARQEGDFTWSGEIRPGEALEIRGVNGDVVARPATGDRVEVVAHKRGRRNDASEVVVQAVEHDGGVTVCAVYPTPPGKRPNVCAPGDEARLSVQHNDVQVDFEVRVPAGVRFEAATVNGEVQATDLDGDVSVSTVNGDVEVATTGFAEASTVNGSLRASVGGGAFAGGVSFETVNGSIDLDLPDDIDANLDASWVNGGLTTDIPFNVQGKLSRRSARGVLGDGGPTLRLKTVNGSIRVR